MTTLIDLREAEVQRAREFFPPAGDVLELGGGNGLAGRAARGMGISRALGRRAIEPVLHFPVELYDGVHLPQADRSVDLIFSSNVLEHVVQRPELFEDMRRVLKADGRMVHIVPSASWRSGRRSRTIRTW